MPRPPLLASADKLLESFVQLQPQPMPRRIEDWSLMKVANYEEGDNYYDSEAREFILSKFKTSKHFAEPQRIAVPKKLQRLIRKSREVNQSDYLLVQANGKPFLASAFTKRMNAIFGKFDSMISVSDLRSVYATETLGETMRTRL
ncbi:hypothetical protein EON64_04215 [archaeon]|nr:MAG: hypothetical protein EON64_04215 [archaeon]